MTNFKAKESFSSKPRIFAHRGSTILAPENTRAAFDLALHYQCDVLETDVRLSKDGHVMVTHDARLERTTNGTGLVRDSTLAELKTLDAGCRFTHQNGDAYRGESMSLLTLHELLELYPSVDINIDIKDTDIEAAAAVASVVKAHKTSCWINVGSFHAKVAHHFRHCAPDTSTAATRQEVAQLLFTPKHSETKAYQVLQIPTSYYGIPLSTKKFISKCQNRNVDIIYWTINDPEQMAQLFLKGVNGIVTDRPDLARDVLQR